MGQVVISSLSTAFLITMCAAGSIPHPGSIVILQHSTLTIWAFLYTRRNATAHNACKYHIDQTAGDFKRTLWCMASPLIFVLKGKPESCSTKTFDAPTGSLYMLCYTTILFNSYNLKIIFQDWTSHHTAHQSHLFIHHIITNNLQSQFICIQV